MSRLTERTLILAAVGVGLAAVESFGPLLWPFGLGPTWSVTSQAWIFLVELLWVGHAVRTRRSMGSVTVDATARVSRYPAHRSDGAGGYGATATGAGAQRVVECPRPSGL